MLLTLSGCKTAPRVISSVNVPEELLLPCRIYSIDGNLVKDAIQQSIKNIESLELCNADKKAIRSILPSQEESGNGGL